MLFSVFMLLMVALIVAFNLMSAPRKERQKAAALPSDCNMKCPACNCSLHIEGMLDAAVFFAPGAIVFDCWQCHDRVYFAPYERHVEIGILGCSPVIDPIPCNDYLYPKGFDMVSNILEGILHIQIGARSWAIPRYGLWNERSDVQCPNPAVKRDAPQAARPSP